MTDTSMLDLFRMEVEQQGALLSESLLTLDSDSTATEAMEPAMRACHSIKGAARLVDIPPVVELAHKMEDCFVAAQEGRLRFSSSDIDVFLSGMDLIVGIVDHLDDTAAWRERNSEAYEGALQSLALIMSGEGGAAAAPVESKPLAQQSVASPVALPKTEISPDADPMAAVDDSMLELFRSEVEQHGETLSQGVLALENTPTASELLDSLMRAAHSIKGAARLIGLQPVVDVAHVMEDAFVAAQAGTLRIAPTDVDVLLQSVDVITELSTMEITVGAWFVANGEKFDALLAALTAVRRGAGTAIEAEVTPDVPAPVAEAAPKARVDVVNIADMSMVELFKMEVEQQVETLSQGLLGLEASPAAADLLESLMRASHSIKGAARLIDLKLVVELAHLMEDVFVSAQEGGLTLTSEAVDVLLAGVDMLLAISRVDGELAVWYEANSDAYDALLVNLAAVLAGEAIAAPVAQAQPVVAASEPAPASRESEAPVAPQEKEESKPAALQKDRVLRVSAEQLNRLMGLAGESLVESRWVLPYAGSLQRLKRQQTDLVGLLDILRDKLDESPINDDVMALARSAQRQASYCREIMADRLAELESFDRRATNLSSRLHREVVQSRMRPFKDGMHGFPRMVRDISRSLGKGVQLDVIGENTLVDRDILDKIEAPLNHIIRNAIDHGLEMPDEREASGKPAKGTIKIEAYHHSGMLSVVVKDDGRGIDLERLRAKVREKALVDGEMAESLSDSELLEFLFLPSFSTRDTVSEISGRGVGLDVVHDVVQEMRGSVRATSKLGKGTRFHMQLPLTLSVIPALLTEVSGEPYAFPLARIDRILRVEPGMIVEAEGTQFVRVGDTTVGLVSARQILELGERGDGEDSLWVVVLAERNHYYGLVVDKFLGERELVVQVMPEVLGKVQNISSAALMEDGAPVLIVDVDDLIRSIEKLLKVSRVGKVSALDVEDMTPRKRVLVVDDSITVREVERKLLESIGYQVEVAVDGIDGLNALRSAEFDLLVTDVDMPRMNGIELVRTVRQDPALRSIPIMMVSYKDREEDRMRGLDAGADYYLTKGSFHDESLRDAVLELIGEA